MPRKRNSIHPSLLKNERPEEDNEAAIMTGYPKHGDPAPMDDEDEFEDDEDGFEEEEDELERPETRAERLERELNELKARNAQLEQRIPPAEVRVSAPEAEEEPDWDNLIFTNPAEAMRLQGERIEKQITQKLRGEYQREQSTTRFWNDFYKTHDDLKEDKDIVELMLQKNFSDLANMPTEQAMTKLADLTRQRVMRYSNNRGGKRKRTRAVTTGASNAVRPAAASKETKAPASLSSIIKTRREQRRAGGRMNGRAN